METERIALSQRERDRLRVLHEVKQKQITQVEAAKRLKISDRHIRRLLWRLGEHGDRAVIHGLRGRRSNRRLAARLELKILRRVRQRYADFGPTLAAEHLAQEGLAVSRETLSKWMVKASLCCPRAQRVHIPLRTPVSGVRGCVTEKLALALDSQVECGFAAERKALCEPLDSSFVFLP